MKISFKCWFKEGYLGNNGGEEGVVLGISIEYNFRLIYCLVVVM